MTAALEPLVVPARFRGPASSGNGGWTCGALAERLHRAAPDRAVRAVLRAKPPLDTPMSVELAGDRAVARLDGTVVAEVTLAEQQLVPVPPVTADEARAAETSYAGLRSHPFPTCFACGTGRVPGDGLRIFPGRVADLEAGGERFARVAATWTPDETVTDDGRRATPPVTWAALDCVGGWAGDLAERLIVLGTMTASLHRLPVIGEPHVVVGAARGTSGRRILSASSLYDAYRSLVATAEHVWVGVDPSAFNRGDVSTLRP